MCSTAVKSFIRNSALHSNLRYFSTKQRVFHEIKIPVPWGHIAGKWWEPSDSRPILALHGWQDNCGSFDRLIPLLDQNVGVLAIDLPGHGISSRLPPGMYYHNMNYPIIIRQIAQYFNWPRVTLMGHSLGAISCYIYTMLFPDNVDFLVCIDGVKPLEKPNNGPRMAEGMDEHLKYDELARSSQEPPSYPLEVMAEKISASNNNSISIEHCHHILNRNIAQSAKEPNNFYFTRDPRLKSRLILNWAQKELLEGAARVTTPLFMVKFLGSGYFEKKENFYNMFEILKKTSRDCQYHYVEGSHHAHLNNPERVSSLINEFIQKHNNLEDRNNGGLKNAIIVS